MSNVPHQDRLPDTVLGDLGQIQRLVRDLEENVAIEPNLIIGYYRKAVFNAKYRVGSMSLTTSMKCDDIYIVTWSNKTTNTRSAPERNAWSTGVLWKMPPVEVVRRGVRGEAGE